MAEPTLRMTGIQKSFPGVRALGGVQLEAYAGEVLALVGANGAGKSTLMNILGGVFPPDNGQIVIEGQAVTFGSPLDAARHGIAFVHQEMAMLPTMTIADNIFISNFPVARGRIDYANVMTRSKQALTRLGCTFDPRTRVGDLSPGDQQMVEIARAILTEPKIIIFDEPTSSLTRHEKARLFSVIATLKRDGVTIIYISHFLDEIFGLCDRALVLRNGETAGSDLTRNLTQAAIVEMMIGTKLITDLQHGGQPNQRGPIALRVGGLRRRGVLREVGFEIHQSEVVGLWGLLGSGRTELIRALVGLDPIDGGVIELRLDGELRRVRPSVAGRHIGMITENRREEGLLLPMSVSANISLASLPKLVGRLWPFLNHQHEMDQSQQLVMRLSVKTSGLTQTVGTLSGGNQQKVIVSRWLAKNPPIYLMDEPTRGLDVGAKAEIRAIIRDLAKQGAALLVISSEIDEIMSVSDRYLVLNRGRIVAELPADASKNELMATAAGALPSEDTLNTESIRL